MEYTLSFGSTMHSPRIYLGLYSALLAAEHNRFLNAPIFVYDNQCMVAAVGRDGSVQIYDSAQRQAIRKQPRFPYLRIA